MQNIYTINVSNLKILVKQDNNMSIVDLMVLVTMLVYTLALICMCVYAFMYDFTSSKL